MFYNFFLALNFIIAENVQFEYINITNNVAKQINKSNLTFFLY